MTSHELWLSVVFISGAIGKMILNSAVKWLWGRFVHSTEETIDIWWKHKKQHAEETIEEAARIIGGSGP